MLKTLCIVVLHLFQFSLQEYSDSTIIVFHVWDSVAYQNSQNSASHFSLATTSEITNLSLFSPCLLLLGSSPPKRNSLFFSWAGAKEEQRTSFGLLQALSWAGILSHV